MNHHLSSFYSVLSPIHPFFSTLRGARCPIIWNGTSCTCKQAFSCNTALVSHGKTIKRIHIKYLRFCFNPGLRYLNFFHLFDLHIICTNTVLEKSDNEMIASLSAKKSKPFKFFYQDQKIFEVIISILFVVIWIKSGM